MARTWREKKEEDCSAVLGLSTSFYGLNWTSRFFPHFPCSFWASLVASTVQRKIISAKQKRSSPCAADSSVWRQKQQDVSKLLVPWRFWRLEQREMQRCTGRSFIHSKKSRTALSRLTIEYVLCEAKDLDQWSACFTKKCYHSCNSH